jgi:hypothetical protein
VKSKEGKFNLKVTGNNREVNVGGDLTVFDDDRIKASVSGQIDYDLKRKKVKDGQAVFKMSCRLWKRNRRKQCVKDHGGQIRTKEEYEQTLAELRCLKKQVNERWNRQLRVIRND